MVEARKTCDQFEVAGSHMTHDELKEGRDYVYDCPLPKGCAGHLYRLHRFVLDVPSYQEKCLVECLGGRDTGLWFVCSVANFMVRYRPAVCSGGV
jgi:hypothetical protein